LSSKPGVFFTPLVIEARNNFQRPPVYMAGIAEKPMLWGAK
jgi:hypothetical protein